MIIYKITNKENNLSYIGKTTQTLEKRFKQHIRKALNDKKDTHFYRAIRKYGNDCWTSEVLENVEDAELLNEREMFWIECYNSYNNGYNSTHGGDGIEMTEEIRLKLSKTKTGKKVGPFTEEHLNNLRLNNAKGMLGKKHTVEANKKRSLSMKDRHVGEKNPMFGRSPPNKGIPCSDEMKLKISEGIKLKRQMKKENNN